MQQVTVFLIVLFIAIATFFAWQHLHPYSLVSPIATHSPPPSPTIYPKVTQTVDTLFVPYWSLEKSTKQDTYKTVVYFGIAPSEDGIDHNDAGYKNLLKFNTTFPGGKHLLTVRMIDTKLNSKVLDSKSLQKKITQESIAIARNNGFDGVVLDFEISALAFPSVIKSITSFYQDFGKQVQANNLSFAVTLYGDTFYRARPYDVKTITKEADTVFIMAYDFHKANGTPGPNFPMYGKQTYGYDLQTMVGDFIHAVALQKLVVTFGLFGYDWQLSSNGQSLGTAKALSTNEMQQTFVPCPFTACTSGRDKNSLEMQTTYRDAENHRHVVWYEDVTSALKKKELLKQQGISSFGYWAYSYF